MTARMSSVPSNLTEKARELLSSILKHAVTEESQLAAATQRYVWRVRGSPMLSLHRLFTEQGRQIDRWLGELGTQARAMGVAFGAGRVAEETGGTADDSREPPPAARTAIGDLLALHEGIASRLRHDMEALHDGASDLTPTTAVLTGLLEFHETTAWMLRLLLESSERAPSAFCARARE